MTNPLLQAIEELKKEDELKKKKKKPSFELRKEKRLNYYSGWGEGNKDSTKIEQQKKLRE
ncbi:MAG: hypothetical protein KKC75_03590 [Nanoarchaeota archaeon]|nr:hypothetical protein [Nanoarchaeota archaeon]MBU1005119.1 hypothetical protein [Nanoarchaeota archaeon]MBU1946822.1 hypothetical protein [Nanoarchaeota archaeon]